MQNDTATVVADVVIINVIIINHIIAVVQCQV
jgi:hypothetical protein